MSAFHERCLHQKSGDSGKGTELPTSLSQGCSCRFSHLSQLLLSLFLYILLLPTVCFLPLNALPLPLVVLARALSSSLDLH